MTSHPKDDEPNTRPGKGQRLVDDFGEFRPGTVIGNYVVRGELRSGGFGTVYQVEHITLRRPAAMKILHAELARSTPEAAVRFEREARAVNLIRHPNVVDIYEFGQLDDGRPYFVMELLAGVDLGAYVGTHGALPADETLVILTPLCDALSAAHAKGIIHRDIKGSNVFLSERDGRRRVVLLDFGVAKMLEYGESGGITSTRQIIGTPSFMSPEQILNRPIDARSDIYSLGALTFHMLTGSLPFPDRSPTVLRNLHVSAPRPRPSTFISMSPLLDAVIVRAMATSPDQRYGDVREFLDELTAAVNVNRPQGNRASGELANQWAVGVYVETRLADAAVEDPSDDMLADLGNALDLARQQLTDAGLLPALDVGNGVLLVYPCSQSDETATSDVLAKTRTVYALLSGRPNRQAAVHVNVCLHRAPIIQAGRRVLGGPLTHVGSWAPEAAISGIVATKEFCAATASASAADPLPGLPDLFRLRDL